jgi:transcription elongation factor B subunit 2
MVRRQKTTIFIDAKESTPVSELKRMLQGIVKRAAEYLKLYKEDQVYI